MPFVDLQNVEHQCQIICMLTRAAVKEVEQVFHHRRGEVHHEDEGGLFGFNCCISQRPPEHRAGGRQHHSMAAQELAALAPKVNTINTWS